MVSDRTSTHTLTVKGAERADTRFCQSVVVLNRWSLNPPCDKFALERSTDPGDTVAANGTDRTDPLTYFNLASTLSNPSASCDVELLDDGEIRAVDTSKGQSSYEAKVQLSNWSGQRPQPVMTIQSQVNN